MSQLNEFLRQQLAEMFDNYFEGADEEAVTSIFNSFDLNGDGKISASELKRCMSDLTGKRVTNEEVADMIRESDRNGDGAIDLQEFINAMHIRMSEE